MCTVCGCGAGEVKIEGHVHSHVHEDGTVHTHAHDHAHHGHDHQHESSHDHDHHTHAHTHADGTTHSHSHDHASEHGHGADHHHDHPAHPTAPHHEDAHAEHGDHDHGSHSHDLDFGAGPARAHVPGLSQARMVQIEQSILSKNDRYAAANRQRFDERGILTLNLVSSPGSGKTTLLCRTIASLKDDVTINVVEGDQQTANDAERIRATGVPALQINTGKGCHLDAHMVGHAVERLQPADASLFLIENVGNLVCPAAFDLGEHHKVAILSVTEGEDKPLKYPDMFAAADVMLLNKCDLLPHLQFDAELAKANALRVNPRLTIFTLSATSGEGMAEWLGWIRAALAAQAGKRAETVDRLKARIAELERQLERQVADRH